MEAVTVVPNPQQLHTAAVIRSSRTSKYKGMVVAGEPDLSNYLSVMLAIRVDFTAGDSPSVVVVPPSRTLRW